MRPLARRSRRMSASAAALRLHRRLGFAAQTSGTFHLINPGRGLGSLLI